MSKSLMTSLKTFSQSEIVYKKLKGLFCVYKPPDVDLQEILYKLKYSLVKGVNELPSKPTESLVTIDEKNDIIKLEQNLADTVQASGYRYIRKDFLIDFLHPLDKLDSGIIIGSINDKEKLQEKVEKMRLIRVYQIKGRLGVCTDDFTGHGRLMERATYGHVNRSKLERLVSTIQAVYQREMFKYFGFDVRSQEAYECASKGLLRPISNKTPPQIYSIRCIDFDRPYFKIEVHTINENTLFLRNLIHDIGIKLKTYAICVQIRRIQDGFIDLNSNCLVHNELEDFDKFYNNLLETNKICKNFLKENNIKNVSNENDLINKINLIN